MTLLRSFLSIILSEIFIKKVIAYTLLFVIGYILVDFLMLFFATFLFAYIFLELGTYVSHRIHAWWEHGKVDTPHRIAKKYSTANIVITGIYIIFIGILVFIFINIIPQIGSEIRNFLNNSGNIAHQGQDFIAKIESSLNLNLWLNEMIGDVVSPDNLESVGQKAFTYVTNAGIIFTKFLIALILSYIFIIDRFRIKQFLSQIRNGNFRFLYDEWAIIAKKMWAWFGLVFKAQSIIALVNALLTSIGLIVISFYHGWGAFPFVFTLSLIVFICGFIPVFGTFLSWIPILILAYGYGASSNTSITIVILCLIMIAIVHAVEAYYLNPKIVSSYVNFPMFITFLILIISEHFFGLIGLLAGVPLFSIVLSFIEDIDWYISSKNSPPIKS